MANEIETLLDEVRLLYHRMVQVADEIHRDEPVTLGMRAVMEFLLKNGPTTVPDIARRRFVTRQHIQTLVNALQAGDFITFKNNPSHKRSFLVSLTGKGTRLIRSMRRREERLYRDIDLRKHKSQLAQAARVLKEVRQALGRHL